jgi:hypothetical protein
VKQTLETIMMPDRLPSSMCRKERGCPGGEDTKGPDIMLPALKNLGIGDV